MTERRTILLTSVDQHQTRCKSCNAPVRWAQTARGRRVLIEAAASFVDDPAGRRVYADYVHFANCPHADQHRKREREQRYPPDRRFHGD